MKHKSAKGAPSVRLLRVGESLRHALSEMLSRNELGLTELEGHSITVSEVRVSPDLRHATAFVMPLGGADLDEMMRVLGRVAPAFQKALGKVVQTKYTPRLSFRVDESFDEADRIDRLLNQPKVRADLEKDDPAAS
ncbi:MAG: 30S ribosome-binding factor RbfA [Pseudomonadota bacterium]